MTKHNGTLYVLCFSDEGPGTGPHPVSQEELRAAFNRRNGWSVATIQPQRLQTRYHDDGAPGLARCTQTSLASGELNQHGVKDERDVS